MTPLQTYIKHIGQYPLLTAEEEIELSRIIQTSKRESDRKKALDKLVLGNLRLVIACANKIFINHHSFDLMDLIQEGNNALVRIAQLYDYKKNKTRFSTYAYQSVIRRMVRAIHIKSRFIRIPTHHSSYTHQLLEMAFKNGDNDIENITLNDILNEEDLTPNTKKLISAAVLEKLKEEKNSVVVFFEKFQEMIENTLKDENTPNNGEIEKQKYMRQIVSETCSPLVQSIIQEIFYKQTAVQDCARKLGISKQTIYNHLQPSLIKLRMRVLQDKMDFQEVPVKWMMVMEGKIKPVYRRSRRYAMKKKLEPFIEQEGANNEENMHRLS